MINLKSYQKFGKISALVPQTILFHDTKKVNRCIVFRKLETRKKYLSNDKWVENVLKHNRLFNKN